MEESLRPLVGLQQTRDQGPRQRCAEVSNQGLEEAIAAQSNTLGPWIPEPFPSRLSAQIQTLLVLNESQKLSEVS